MYEYPVDIDFDEASREWTRNKKKLSDGCYSYVCGVNTKQNRPCQNKPINGKCVCAIHKKYKNTIYSHEQKRGDGG